MTAERAPIERARGIEDRFDVAFVAALALKEKQIQQNYRPVIAVHKWFARRPGTLFRALLLSEFGEGDLRTSFYSRHSLGGRRIFDPFMGGGTPLLEANRLGCDVIGRDINPMALWIVREEIESIDLSAYARRAESLMKHLRTKVGERYLTDCRTCRRPAPVKYFLWVKTQPCVECGESLDLFPGFLLATDQRHTSNVFVCPECGELTEAKDRSSPGDCGSCGTDLAAAPAARRNRCICPRCEVLNAYPNADFGPPQHRLFAIEYHCPACRPHHRGRFFKKPDNADLKRYEECETALARLRPHFIPTPPIPSGDETNRLLRWGYRRYREMFNARQLLGLELAARFIARERDVRIRRALATNLSDLLRYQNMLCRYDVAVLKSLDVFSIHGFPVGLVQCESNLIGVPGANGKPVGSGGWLNIVEKYIKAKSYCDAPFEIARTGGRTATVSIPGEWIGERRPGEPTRQVCLSAGDSAAAALPAESLDAAFTDPPYYGNVQYAELMEFCYVWLRRLFPDEPAFAAEHLRSDSELTGNATENRGLEHFTAGLSRVYAATARALKPGAPFAFTFHHNDVAAYHAVCVALLDADFTVTAAFPCPAEMGGSIHINGTGSSILDTVFVARRRSPGAATTAPEVALVPSIREDVLRISEAGHRPTPGDVRCIVFGRAAQHAVRSLAADWDCLLPIPAKLARVATFIQEHVDVSACIAQASPPSATSGARQRTMFP